MRALTVRQPYAGLIAAGSKTIEVRSWPTRHRGPLVIHSGRGDMAPDPHLDPFVCWVRQTQPEVLQVRGAFLAVVDLVDCRPMRLDDEPAALARYDRTAWAWVLANPKVIEPIPAFGAYSLWAPLAADRRALARADRRLRPRQLHLPL